MTIALYHFHVTQIKRSAGQSAIASAAYRSGKKLHSEYYGEDSDYTRKGGVICSEILLPSHAPPEYANRETLWNAVEKVERGKKAQLAYSFDIALQNEFSMQENIDLARQFWLDNFVSRGMVVDFAVHQSDKEDGGIQNPHFHVMCPIRPIEPDGRWGNKQRREYVLDEDGNRIRYKATAYKESQGINSPNKRSENPYAWQDSTVVHILERMEYTGCTVNFKTYTNSIWDKKQRDNPIEKQSVFPNTHERIIEDDVFKRVQEIRQQRHRMTRTGRSSIFSGLVYCVDCGSKMLYGATNNGDPKQDYFDCSLHRKDKEKCNGHFIRAKVLERMVLKHIQTVMDYILRYESYFRRKMEAKLRLDSTEQIRIRRKKLEQNEKRIAELKRLFIRIYEGNTSGKLSDERFDMLSQSYEAEQKQLEAEAITLQQEIEVQERQNENIEKFIQKAHKYVGIEELDGYALRELVSAIYVDAPDKSSGKRVQHIHIKYDGIGFIPLNELLKEETA